MAKNIYLIAEGGKPKEVLDAWRESVKMGQKAMQEYMDEIGAIGAFRINSFDKPDCFRFRRNREPEGWLKPGSNGATRPKKANRTDSERLANLPWCESLDKVVIREFNLPTSIQVGENYRRLPEGSILTIYSACWTSDKTGQMDVILIAPNFGEVSAELDGETVNWLPEGTKPTIPDGFRQVTEAEVDLIFAQAEVDRERAASKENEPQV